MFYYLLTIIQILQRYLSFYNDIQLQALKDILSKIRRTQPSFRFRMSLFLCKRIHCKKNSSSWYESHLEKLVFLKVVDWMNACMKLTWHLHHSFHNYCLTIKWISINLNASFNSNMVFVAFDEDMKLLLFILIILLEFYAGRLRFD